MPVDRSLPDVGELHAYLRLQGWQEIAAGSAGTTWCLDDTRVGVPHDNSDPDLIEGAVRRIAKYERREMRELATAIRYLLYDVTHLRAVSGRDVVDAIPLEAAAKILAQSRKMFQAAGTTARWLRAQIGNSYSTIGNQVVSQALMGHTERGSFVIPVLVRLPEPESPDVHSGMLVTEEGFHRSAPEPFERRVVRTFAQSMQALQEVVTEAAYEPSNDQIYELVYRGVSREFCAALAIILSEPSVSQFGSQVDWAPAVTPPTSMLRPVTIESDAAVLIKRVAHRLSHQRVDPSDVFSGTIVQLRHDERDDPFGEIAVSTVRRGRPSEIRVRLDLAQYRRAWEWHDAGRAVLVEGAVRAAPGRPLMVDQPTRIHPVDEMMLLPPADIPPPRHQAVLPPREPPRELT